MGNFRAFALKSAALAALLAGSTLVSVAPSAQAASEEWIPPLQGMAYVGSELTIGETRTDLIDCPPTEEAPQGFVLEWLSNGVPLPAERQGEFLKLTTEDQGNRISFNVHGECSASEVFQSIATPPIAASNRAMGWTGRGNYELLGRTDSGELILYPRTYESHWQDGGFWARDRYYTSSWDTPRVVGTGWAIFNIVFSPGDFDRDGHNDVLARDSAGNLFLYPGNGAGDWLPTVQVGAGWNIFDSIIAGGDFSGDGNNDVLARDSVGDLFLYPGDGDGGWLAPKKVGVGWQVFDKIVASADTDGDGAMDVFARKPSGVLHQYPSDGHGAWKAPSVGGPGWEVMTEIIGAGTFHPGRLNFRPASIYDSGFPMNDITAIDKEGYLRHYYGSREPGGLYGGHHIGNGWDILNTLI
ncbi:VCBS repeat-containing protein [Arthrobacter sp. ISL-95]|uniref:FG-GAP repeat domain-containing protein n=1 Tax=Arthrobacter sp. ISL-95 TaxID=2819116 RepID=UPI001BE9622A|nr:VCBS repeat-containing protein [Arthrobacter sp. ISL-95]MBT2585017.1 VCBS repeat-containing protein [Arthrobacter sp. ISL-95]